MRNQAGPDQALSLAREAHAGGFQASMLDAAAGLTNCGIDRAAVYALTKWLNCSPIYVVNRDDAEVATFIGDFQKGATAAFKPELVHVKTVAEAEKLASPGTIPLLFFDSLREGVWDSGS